MVDRSTEDIGFEAEVRRTEDMDKRFPALKVDEWEERADATDADE